jgi:hypothetical protein
MAGKERCRLEDGICRAEVASRGVPAPAGKLSRDKLGCEMYEMGKKR